MEVDVEDTSEWSNCKQYDNDKKKIKKNIFSLCDVCEFTLQNIHYAFLQYIKNFQMHYTVR